MKKLLLLSFVIFCGSAFAQKSNGDEETNCYLRWVKKFEQRGSDEVEDGVHEGVIITFRKGSHAECYNGKVEVSKGKITNMWLAFETGTYEPVEKKFRYEKVEITIINGISKTIVTQDDQLINVIFPKKLKAKKPGYVKAPDPEIGD